MPSGEDAITMEFQIMHLKTLSASENNQHCLNCEDGSSAILDRAELHENNVIQLLLNVETWGSQGVGVFSAPAYLKKSLYSENDVYCSM